MWLLSISLSFLLINLRSTVGIGCVPNELRHKASAAPSVTISAVEFPGENVLPIGYNVTIACTSNASTFNHGFYGQPYWIHFYFNRNFWPTKTCGGSPGRDDSEDSKVCSYSIQSATKNNSGNYTCRAYNQIKCTEGTLKLEFRVTAAHQGKYWCEAQNLKGWKRSSSTTVKLEPKLETNQLPVFYRHPKSITVSLGDKVVFRCAAKGSPAPEIIWLKDGMMYNREKATVFQGNESTYDVLKISMVKSESRGYYSCQATNAIGSTISKEAALSITGETSSTSNSAGDSNVVWIPIVTAAVILVALVISILLIHKKYREPALEDNREMNARLQFPHLHLQRNNIHQQLRNSNAYVDSP